MCNKPLQLYTLKCYLSGKELLVEETLSQRRFQGRKQFLHLCEMDLDQEIWSEVSRQSIKSRPILKED